MSKIFDIARKEILNKSSEKNPFLIQYNWGQKTMPLELKQIFAIN
jgi:hypothetical protein